VGSGFGGNAVDDGESGVLEGSGRATSVSVAVDSGGAMVGSVASIVSVAGTSTGIVSTTITIGMVGGTSTISVGGGGGLTSGRTTAWVGRGVSVATRSESSSCDPAGAPSTEAVDWWAVS